MARRPSIKTSLTQKIKEFDRLIKETNKLIDRLCKDKRILIEARSLLKH